MIERFKERIGFGLLLNLILPGAGHVYWREYLFGTFVFLVMTIAAVLLFFSFLVELPVGIRMMLFGLPTVFYVFSYVDLWRSIRRSGRKEARSVPGAWAFFLIAMAVCLVLPLSPVNLVLRNLPEIVRVEAGQLRPVLNDGDVCLVNRAAYRVNLFFLDEPYPRRAPVRWDLVRFRDGSRSPQTGLVLGNSGEEVVFFNDSLFVDGYPVPGPKTFSLGSGGQVPLTHVEPNGILVATLKRGAIEGASQISPRDVIGKVHRLF
jgi:signal peptidase I